MTLLRIPIIRTLCASGCCLGFVATAFDVVFVLFSFSPINHGGLGLSVSEYIFRYLTILLIRHIGRRDRVCTRNIEWKLSCTSDVLYAPRFETLRPLRIVSFLHDLLAVCLHRVSNPPQYCPRTCHREQSVITGSWACRVMDWPGTSPGNVKDGMLGLCVSQTLDTLENLRH